jgi:GNAT superfamily N-acetyltransferase
MIIRKAQSSDARGMARVHVESWRTSYAGIVPADFLAALSTGQREARWRDILADQDDQRFNFVAEDPDGQIAGFASGGPERDGDLVYRGELYASYLLASQQRRGLGRQLIKTVAPRLRQLGYSSMLVWVLAKNGPARAFYEAMGGQLLDKKKELTIGGTPLAEVAYGWLDIRMLAARRF